MFINRRHTESKAPKSSQWLPTALTACSTARWRSPPLRRDIWANKRLIIASENAFLFFQPPYQCGGGLDCDLQSQCAKVGGGSGYQNKLQAPAFVKGVLLVVVTADGCQRLFSQRVSRSPLLLHVTPLVAPKVCNYLTECSKVAGRTYVMCTYVMCVYRSIVTLFQNVRISFHEKIQTHMLRL